MHMNCRIVVQYFNILLRKFTVRQVLNILGNSIESKIQLMFERESEINLIFLIKLGPGMRKHRREQLEIIIVLEFPTRM